MVIAEKVVDIYGTLLLLIIFRVQAVVRHFFKFVSGREVEVELTCTLEKLNLLNVCGNRPVNNSPVSYLGTAR